LTQAEVASWCPRCRASKSGLRALEGMLAIFFIPGHPMLETAIDRPPWLAQALDLGTWAPLALNSHALQPPTHTGCAALSATDCEDADALKMFFWRFRGGGISLEMGGQDGIRNSATLSLAKRSGFKRILIEANPTFRGNRMKASSQAVGVTAAVCSTSSKLHFLFGDTPTTFGIAEFMSAEFMRRWHRPFMRAMTVANLSHDELRASSQLGEKWKVLEAAYPMSSTTWSEVQCTTLTRILDAIRVHSIHLFVLDTEGSELDILRTVEWAKVRFGVLVVEVTGEGTFRRPSYAREVTEFMLSATGGQYRLLFPRPRGRNLWFAHTSFEDFLGCPPLRPAHQRAIYGHGIPKAHLHPARRRGTVESSHHEQPLTPLTWRCPVHPTVLASLLSGNTSASPCPKGGIAGSHGLHMCCPASCGECGGRRCELRPGGAEACCASAIHKSRRLCSDAPPPCTP